MLEGTSVGVLIEDDMWAVLSHIPASVRSRVINEALRTCVAGRRRNDVARQLDALRQRLPPVSAPEVARWIREDREQGR